MALTRKALKAMGITDEQIESVIEMHTETIDGLKAQINELKESATEYEKVKQERDELKKEITKTGDADKRYNDLKAEYDKYKADIEAKATKDAKEKAYRELLRKANISEKRLDTILKVTALDDIELDDNGGIKGAEDVTKKIKSEWADFVEKKDTKGAEVSNPPENNGNSGTAGQSRAAQLAARYHANLYGTKE